MGHVDLSKFERKKVEIQPEKKNYYIIDTNVFINCPDILSKIDTKYPIILSAKVIDELDKFKIRSEQEKKPHCGFSIVNLHAKLSLKQQKLRFCHPTMIGVLPIISFYQ